MNDAVRYAIRKARYEQLKLNRVRVKEVERIFERFKDMGLNKPTVLPMESALAVWSGRNLNHRGIGFSDRSKSDQFVFVSAQNVQRFLKSNSLKFGFSKSFFVFPSNWMEAGAFVVVVDSYSHLFNSIYYIVDDLFHVFSAEHQDIVRVEGIRPDDTLIDLRLGIVGGHLYRQLVFD